MTEIVAAYLLQAEEKKADQSAFKTFLDWLGANPHWSAFFGLILALIATAVLFRVVTAKHFKLGPLETDTAEKDKITPAEKTASVGNSATSTVHNPTNIYVGTIPPGPVTPPGGTSLAPSAHGAERPPHSDHASLEAAETDELYWQRSDQLYDTLRHACRYALDSLTWEVEIDPAWGVTIETRRVIRAHDVPVFALCLQRGSQDVEMQDFRDLQVYAVDGSGNSLDWIPALDRKHFKRIIVFLREVLVPGGPSSVIITRTFWAGAAAKLSRPNGYDTQDYALPMAAIGTIPKVGLFLTLPTAGRKTYKVTCQNPAMQRTLPNAENGSKTLELEFDNSHPGREIHFSVTRLT